MKEERKGSNGWEMNYQTNLGEHWLQIQGLAWYQVFNSHTQNPCVRFWQRVSVKQVSSQDDYIGPPNVSQWGLKPDSKYVLFLSLPLGRKTPDAMDVQALN